MLPWGISSFSYILRTLSSIHSSSLGNLLEYPHISLMSSDIIYIDSVWISSRMLEWFLGLYANLNTSWPFIWWNHCRPHDYRRPPYVLHRSATAYRFSQLQCLCIHLQTVQLVLCRATKFIYLLTCSAGNGIASSPGVTCSVHNHNDTNPAQAKHLYSQSSCFLI